MSTIPGRSNPITTAKTGHLPPDYGTESWKTGRGPGAGGPPPRDGAWTGLPALDACVTGRRRQRSRPEMGLPGPREAGPRRQARPRGIEGFRRALANGETGAGRNPTVESRENARPGTFQAPGPGDANPIPGRVIFGEPAVAVRTMGQTQPRTAQIHCQRGTGPQQLGPPFDSRHLWREAPRSRRDVPSDPASAARIRTTLGLLHLVAARIAEKPRPRVRTAIHFPGVLHRLSTHGATRPD
jgi:hypothetical protein